MQKMKKGDEKVVHLQEEKLRRLPLGRRTSPLVTEMNEVLKDQRWLDNLRAAGL